MQPRNPTDFQSTGAFSAAHHAGASDPGARPAWVEEARGALDEPGYWLAYEVDGVEHVVPLAREWTRIGRSLAADVRFDDATVSRRHALLVAQANGVRVLDDRSLNGVYVNGERVEWSALRDGDRINLGRHTLWFLDTAEVAAAAQASTAAGGD